ncbi:MAG: DNA cytosine methyltransferase [Candidatus Accumulibacter sp.]|jgi:DNA (cytosine-5)-methyltransferase 1|nr:DNA cytosine methyltransferase [Accumulibacter sp.]
MPDPFPSPTPLRYGSVCSGIEAVSLAWRPLGLEPAWFAEIDPFPNAVLAHHYPEVPNLGDMTRLAERVRAGAVCAPDILVGGTPCVSFSVSGARRGLADPRGALTLSYVELANAIDDIRIRNRQPPALLVWENVPGVLSDRANAFGSLLGALAGESGALEPPGAKWTHAGCVSGPRRRIVWRVLDSAQHFGLAQRRRRLFLVASGRDDLDPGEILFECERLSRHSSPGGAARQGAAAALAPGAGAAGDGARLNRDGGRRTVAFGGGNTRGPVDVAAGLTAAAGPRNDFEVETFMVPSVAGKISPTLSTANNGKGCGEDGSGRDVPIVAARAPRALAFAQNSRGELRLESGHGQIFGTLSTGGGKPGQGRPMIASVSLRGREHGLQAELGGPIAPAPRAAGGGADKGHVLAPGDCEEGRGTPGDADTEGMRWRIRRLMPLECERLQGLPDHYTRVPYRGKPAADAPRYKAIGNSMAVPCLAWIGARLLRACREPSGTR